MLRTLLAVHARSDIFLFEYIFHRTVNHHRQHTGIPLVLYSCTSFFVPDLGACSPLDSSGFHFLYQSLFFYFAFPSVFEIMLEKKRIERGIHCIPVSTSDLLLGFIVPIINEARVCEDASVP